MKILVDVYGGDLAPQAVIDGAIDAVSKNSDIEVVLVGKKLEIEPLVKTKYLGNKISYINATEIISNEDTPTSAIREKKDSSMVVALRTLRDDKSFAGVVSAGSTGALLFGAITICKRIKGISRPCLAPLWPTIDAKRNMVLVDSGANADCKPVNLQHFALMGSAFMSAMYDIKYPRVGLLSNGAEEGKGNDLTKETYPLLKSMDNINFIGNAEARDLLFNHFDVVVSDGFTGNIALKACEGTALAVLRILKDCIKKYGIRTKIGALLMKPALREVKHRLDINELGGGTFLGVQGIVVKAHGSSNSQSFRACIEQVAKLYSNNIIDNISSSVQTLGEAIDE